MIDRTVLAFAGLALCATAMPAAAEGNTYGYDHIAARNLQAAEKRLEQQRAEEPDEPSVLINLAWVYRKTGRSAAAEALYERVLAQPDVLMALGSGKPAWSHTLAMKGLGRSTAVAAATSPRP